MLTDSQKAPLILLVEDDDNHAALMKESLQNATEEYRLVIADTMRDAHSAIERQTPDLVLTDFRLPDGDGSELVATLQGLCPVILMTSQGNEQVAVDAMKAGVLDYVVKTPEKLLGMSRVAQRGLREWCRIQEKKRAEEALHIYQIELEQQNEKLRSTQNELDVARARYFDLYDLAPVGYLTVSDNGLLLEANLAAANMFQLSRSALLNNPLSQFICKEDHGIYFLQRKKCFASSSPLVWEMRLARADGSLFWARLQANPAEGGELWVTINDISREKRGEEDLLASRDNLKAALDATADGILAVGADGRVLFSNRRFAELWSVPQAILDNGDDNELLDHVLAQLSEPQAFLAEVQRLYASDEESVDQIYFRDGRVFDRYSLPMRQEGRKTLGRVWSFRDITERKLTEEKLKEFNNSLELSLAQAVDDMRQKDQILIMQERRAAMGEMINNIAHQWRQPLNVLGLNLQELPFACDKPEFSREYLQTSIDKSMLVIEHMSQTIDDFRNFFKPDKKVAPFSVNNVIRRTLSIMEKSFQELHVQISFQKEDSPVVNGYPNEYAQTLLNILGNARDALIARHHEDAQILIRLFEEDGKTVVTIADNAGGIADDIIDHIFEPYFTTKGPDKGTGIGLFMSKCIIEKNMGGSLTVRNTGSGAEFRIEI